MTDSCKFEKLIIYHSNLKALKHINFLTRITSFFLKPEMEDRLWSIATYQ